MVAIQVWRDARRPPPADPVGTMTAGGGMSAGMAEGRLRVDIVGGGKIDFDEKETCRLAQILLRYFWDRAGELTGKRDGGTGT